jgi:hypothetical protein
MLVLLDVKVPPDAAGVLGAAAGAAGFDPTAIALIAARRGDSTWTCRREDFEGYMQAVERTVSFVDELQLGDQE